MFSQETSDAKWNSRMQKDRLPGAEEKTSLPKRSLLVMDELPFSRLLAG